MRAAPLPCTNTCSTLSAIHTDAEKGACPGEKGGAAGGSPVPSIPLMSLELGRMLLQERKRCHFLPGSGGGGGEAKM